jgi:hypothetical protein
MKRLLVGVSVCAAACGGGASSTSPTPLATALTITLTDVLRVSEAQQASATATVGGQPQSVTTGFRSDSSSVATVTDGGLVTGVGNGLANIFTIFGGMQGTKQIRVVPNYQGQWQGTYIVRSCTASGSFNNCRPNGGLFAVGNVLPASMTLAQTADTISGNFFLGSVAHTPITTQIAGDGSAVFVGTSTNSTTISADTTWSVSILTDGRMTGRHTQVFQSTVAAGTMIVESEIVDAMMRTSLRTTAAMGPVHALAATGR